MNTTTLQPLLNTHDATCKMGPGCDHLQRFSCSPWGFSGPHGLRALGYISGQTTFEERLRKMPLDKPNSAGPVGPLGIYEKRLSLQKKDPQQNNSSLEMAVLEGYE